jgi:UDP-hydrolysing UDP-N-acetyl-D-glucosamine 2-epimerase
VKKRKICLVTGNRADWGLLKPLASVLRSSDDFILQICATGSHLSPEFGLTFREILDDGFEVLEKPEILLSSDTPDGVCASMGLAMIGISTSLQRLQPDLIVLLGDRFEIFCAAAVALVHKIPIAHIHGGETTEGCFDEAFRHSITKMSHWHFCSTVEYRQRIIQLGEHPERVFWIGAIGLSDLASMDFFPRDALENDLGTPFAQETVLITFHATTLESVPSSTGGKNLLKVLEKFPSLRVIVTRGNPDPAGRELNGLFADWVSQNPERAIMVDSLGRRKFLSCLKHVTMMAGNSSAGIIEAPSFSLPVVNIGDRQKGRVRGKNVIDCGFSEQEIEKAFSRALSPKFQRGLAKMKNPYFQDNPVGRMMEIIRQLPFPVQMKKGFFDIPVENHD